MTDRRGNSSVSETELSPGSSRISMTSIQNGSEPDKTRRNFINHISEVSSSINEENKNIQTIELLENPILLEEIRPLSEVSQHADELTKKLDLSTGRIGYNKEIDPRENPYVIQVIDDPLTNERKKKSSLAESDDSNDDDHDPRKKRVKCMQYIALFICAIFLTIIVVYYGSGPDEELEYFRKSSKIVRENNLIDHNRILEETITEVLLKFPVSQKEVDESLRNLNIR